jgi:hypothetical protein
VTHFSGTPFENLADKVVIKLYARGASQLVLLLQTRHTGRPEGISLLLLAKFDSC